jgi:hypothetical protein
MLEKAYPSIDECLIATHSLTHTSYKEDNAKVFDYFKRLIYNSNYWQFALIHDDARDGRAAYLAVKTQAEGQSSNATFKAAAYKLIADAKYTGTGKMTFDTYVSTHQRAHNELYRLEEPVAETKKVTDFLTGIRCNDLNPAICFIQGTPHLLTNFEACQQYLKMVVSNAQNLKVRSTPHQVASVTTDTGSKKQSNGKRGGRQRDRNGKRQKSGTRKDPNPDRRLPRIRAGHYSEEEFKALTDAERAEVKRLRQALKQNSTVAATTSTAPAAAAANATSSVASVVTVATINSDASEPVRTALEQTHITPPNTASPTVTLGAGNPRRTGRPKWFDPVPQAVASPHTPTRAAAPDQSPNPAAAAPHPITGTDVPVDQTDQSTAVVSSVAPPAASGVTPTACSSVAAVTTVAAATPQIPFIPPQGAPWYNKLDNPNKLTKNQRRKRNKHFDKVANSNLTRTVMVALSSSEESEDEGYDSEFDRWMIVPSKPADAGKTD